MSACPALSASPAASPSPAVPAPAGLLLNNLSVYRGCEIVFDSMDVPESALDGALPADAAALVGGCWEGSWVGRE